MEYITVEDAINHTRDTLFLDSFEVRDGRLRGCRDGDWCLSAPVTVIDGIEMVPKWTVTPPVDYTNAYELSAQERIVGFWD